MNHSIDHSSLINALKDLVRIDSRSSAQGGCEGAVQRYMADQMRAAGAERVRLFDVEEAAGFREHPLCHGPSRSYADRPTMLAEIGPADAPALLIVAHADTVPLFAPGEWTVDPLAAVERDGAIYGLGVSDDKWGLATMIAIACALRGHALTKRLIFASTIDEENGVSNGMLLLMLAGVRAQAALYLDGYCMEIGRGLLGGSNLYVRPRRDDTSDAERRELFRMLTAMAQRLSRQRSDLFDRDGYRDNVIRAASVQTILRDDDGSAVRIMFYTLPGEDRSGVQQMLERAVAETLGAGSMGQYALSYREPWFEATLVDEHLPLIRHLSAAARDVLGREPVVATMSKQDGFVLSNHAKIPTVAFGCTSRVAGRGAFHCPDEYLTIREMTDGAAIAYQAVRRWLAEDERE